VRVAAVSVPVQAHGMQLGAGLASAPIAGPIPRVERALRRQELLKMVCYAHQGSRPHLVRLSHYVTALSVLAPQMKSLSRNRIFDSRGAPSC
jgi:hypothetical protein